MPKLTDTQLIILAAAAKRDDGSILPLPKKLTCGANAIEAVLPDLIKKKLAAEEPPTDGAPSWRETTDGQPMALTITASGLRAIGAEHPTAKEAKSSPRRPAEGPKVDFPVDPATA